MPDYIYLLENRLSPAQQSALRQIREAARDQGMTVFLTGGAVRDLTSGSPVRDLDVSVQGNALELKKPMLHAGMVLWGEHTPSRTLFFRSPGGVRVELTSTRREEFPKPGKPVYHWDSINEDLRRRDFTVNAMALSLNEGSYGLLMDPTNGVADLEMRTLRLVSNYGFLEDPIRLVRATRLSARLGWQMDERTQARFENARQEGVTSAISAWQKGYELEEIGHEENPLQILRAMEAAGWMQELNPSWTSAKADPAGLEEMHEVLTRLEMQGIRPDGSTAAMELLTAKMEPKEIEALKKSFVRPGFVRDWERLEAEAEEFARQLTAKGAGTPSSTWKLFMRGNPDAILWLGLTGKAAAVQGKFKNFFNVWPAARQKVPAALMLEMRITPELDRYPELLEELFYQTIDGRLETEEQMRAFLEPYSPPAPPPPVTVRRARGPKKSAEKKQAAAEIEASEAEQVPVPGQEAEEQEVARRDIPAVPRPTPVGKTSTPKKGAAAGGTAAAEPLAKAAAKATAPKKAVPESKAPARQVPTPVQAATRLAGGKASAPAKAETTHKTAAKPAAAKAAGKGAPAKRPAKTVAKAPAHGKPVKKMAAKAAAAPAKKAARKKAPAKASSAHGRPHGAKAPAAAKGKHGAKQKTAARPAKKAASKGGAHGKRR